MKKQIMLAVAALMMTANFAHAARSTATVNQDDPMMRRSNKQAACSGNVANGKATDQSQQRVELATKAPVTTNKSTRP